MPAQAQLVTELFVITVCTRRHSPGIPPLPVPADSPGRPPAPPYSSPP